jgi:hypothetical protein
LLALEFCSFILLFGYLSQKTRVGDTDAYFFLSGAGEAYFFTPRAGGRIKMTAPAYVTGRDNTDNAKIDFPNRTKEFFYEGRKHSFLI